MESIAEVFGVSRTGASSVLNGHTWSWIEFTPGTYCQLGAEAVLDLVKYTE